MSYAENTEVPVEKSRAEAAEKRVAELERALAERDAELADLKNAGGPPFIRSEAIRNLKNDLDAARTKLAKLESEYPWRLALYSSRSRPQRGRGREQGLL